MTVMTARRAVSILMATAMFCWSQEFRGTLTGRVTDSQSAVVPGVKIVAIQVASGGKYETVSGPEGLYTLPFLPPGSYRVTAEASGFKRYVREGVTVSTGERLTLDIGLEIGQLTETVTVSAETSLLETATASSGQVITSRQIEDMPLRGRTALVLAQLAVGVIYQRTDRRSFRPFDNAGPSEMSMGGAPSRTNELLMDGAPNSTGNSRVAYNPPVDSVEELRVHAFEADAAYGHTGGGTVNMTTKGGTNSLHGAAYEFKQFSILAATPFFTNLAGLAKTHTRYNQWGINAGGPVVIPKVLDGRNRLFFHFAYEGLKDAIPLPRTSTVPTAAERNGDFSQLLSLASAYQIYDPLTGVREGTRVRRQPFPNNVIPSNRLHPIAKNYFQFYPLPNQAARSDGRDNFLSNTNGEYNSFNNELGRLDFNFSDRHKLFFNFRHNERIADGESLLGGSGTDITAGRSTSRTNWGTTVDDVYTFTPTLVLNVRLNWTRFIEAYRNFSSGFDITSLGFPATLAAVAPEAVLPRVAFNAFTGLGDAGAASTPDDVFQVFSVVMKVAGKHSLKMGGDLRLYRQSAPDNGYSSGQYQFGTGWTTGPLDNSPASPLGQDLAAFLLGLPTGGGFDVNAARTNQAGYYSLFLQDDFRARPNLTLNLGIRYEKDLPTTERYDRSVNGFDFLTPSPISARASAAYDRNPIPQIPVGQFRTPGGLLFAGPGNREIYRTPSRYFSPRFGFAWSPAGLGGRTVVRGGAGVFFFPYGTTGVNQIGFSQTTSLVASADGFLTPSATLSNPFPGGIERPTGSSQGLATYLGKSVSFFAPHPKNPYSIRWALNLQRELRGQVLLEAGYVGNHAVHLGVDRQLNFVPANYLSASPIRDQGVIDFLSAQVSNPLAGLMPGTSLNGSVVGRQQLLLPFPHFPSGGLLAANVNEGSSYFHMFQVRAQKRYSRGLSLQANYQWSKLMERRSRLNASDAQLEKRTAAEDRPQQVVLGGTWDLPFGKGKALASGAGPVLNRMVGGWMLNGIYIVQPGPLLGWGNVIYLGGDLQMDPQRVNRAFDTTRFNRNSQQQLGSNIRTFPSRFANLRADGTLTLDASLLKNTPITEKVNLQFRCEFFNVLNHPVFLAPDLSPTSTGFGTITGQNNLPRTIQMALKLTW